MASIPVKRNRPELPHLLQAVLQPHAPSFKAPRRRSTVAVTVSRHPQIRRDKRIERGGGFKGAAGIGRKATTYSNDLMT